MLSAKQGSVFAAKLQIYVMRSSAGYLYFFFHWDDVHWCLSLGAFKNIFASFYFRNESNLELEEGYGVACAHKSNGWGSETIEQ